MLNNITVCNTSTNGTAALPRSAKGGWLRCWQPIITSEQSRNRQSHAHRLKCSQDCGHAHPRCLYSCTFTLWTFFNLPLRPPLHSVDSLITRRPIWQFPLVRQVLPVSQSGVDKSSLDQMMLVFYAFKQVFFTDGMFNWPTYEDGHQHGLHRYSLRGDGSQTPLPCVLRVSNGTTPLPAGLSNWLDSQKHTRTRVLHHLPWYLDRPWIRLLYRSLSTSPSLVSDSIFWPFCRFAQTYQRLIEEWGGVCGHFVEEN